MGAVLASTPYIWSHVATYQMYRELTRRPRGEIFASFAENHEEATVTIKDLETFFGAGWNGHDVDVLMTFVSDDCVFESAGGAEVCGTRHAGRERVREAAGFTAGTSLIPVTTETPPRFSAATTTTPTARTLTAIACSAITRRQAGTPAASMFASDQHFDP